MDTIIGRFPTTLNSSRMGSVRADLATTRAGKCKMSVGTARLCRMFNRATRGHTPPKYLISDHDRLFQFHRWQANLRILDVNEIKTVPYAPLSHRLLSA